MKKFIVLGLAVLVFAGCDNLATLPEDPYAPAPVAPMSAPPSRKLLNRATMEETFNYAANIHDTMRQYRDALLALPDRKGEAFLGKKSYFMYQTAEWRHLLEIRQEWMGQGDFGPEHPSRKIQLAIYYMMEESKHLDNVFHHDKELDPQFEKSTDDAFRAAAQALTNYQDPPGP